MPLVYCFLYVQKGLECLLSSIVHDTLPKTRHGEAIGGSVLDSDSEFVMIFLGSPCVVEDHDLGLVLIDLEFPVLAEMGEGEGWCC